MSEVVKPGFFAYHQQLMVCTGTTLTEFGLQIGHCGHSAIHPYRSAMDRIAAGQYQITSNGSFLIRRMRTQCPLLPFVAATVQRQVVDCSGHSGDLATESSSAFAVVDANVLHWPLAAKSRSASVDLICTFKADCEH